MGDAMQAIDAKIRRESSESQSRAGRYNPARVALLPGRRHVLPIGDDDQFELYQDGERVYCVSINRRMDYCGVQGYDADDQEPREELAVFCQGSEQVAEALGPKGLDLTDTTIARRLVALLE